MEDDVGFVDPAGVREDEEMAREIVRLKKQGNKKRPQIGKQEAFLEFKASEGKEIETHILESREAIRQAKTQVRENTISCNQSKMQIDSVKSKLDAKADEKKFEGREDFGEEDDMGQKEIIDEEELSWLNELKKWKKDYRESYEKMKENKQHLFFN